MSTHNSTSTPRHERGGASLGRRRLFKGAVAAGGLAAAGVGGLQIAQAAEDDDTADATQSGHPGMLHTQDDFDRMAEQVTAGAEPWIQGWDKLVANGRSHSDWSPRPLATVIRGGDGQNYAQLFPDIAAAYQNALRWKVSGDTAHRDCAVNILNAWSETLVEVTGNADRFLASGIYGYQFSNAAEIVRDVEGFDLPRFQDMITNIFVPMSEHFLTNHNDACITNYWANWDLCNMANILAAGILCDDQVLFDRAVDYFWNGEGNGAIDNAIPFVYDGGLAQWQESGRDQGHSIMGIGLMSSIMEMAWNQGVDLYGANDNAFAKAAEYVARYNSGNDDLPFTTYSWGTGQNCDYREQTVMGEGGRGQARPVWEMVYGHYTQRQGFAMPNVAALAGANTPEGGGGDYGSNSGGYDTLGFGTLAHVRLHWEDIPDDLTPLG
ncbi:alginate lyase family protein [Glycomyces buryatensis]|uniref:Cell wall anchor protein n=1 Tax=Glycomyces buryatensis TaxID=2570927 RepID=A0A4S8QDK3_9ACTN|nr:alginate lyase family protein [Glycomyces buryatensis]THV42633.1 cell wall anchor protein [Glycomyces buryatensis]